ncbi:MAG: histidinol-phosphate transaminase [Anaerovoracaceae bacterium]|nr:histidinol-phosphate transaminase [Anaerovoracaceae bacterium]
MKSESNTRKNNIKYRFRTPLLTISHRSYALDDTADVSSLIDCAEGTDPYGFPDIAGQAIREFDYSRLVDYPHAQEVYDAISQYWKGQAKIIKENIILTDGSDGGMYLINNVFSRPGAVMLGVMPQYIDFVNNAKLAGINYKGIPLDRDRGYSINADDLIDAIDNEISIVYLDNPNNPTGQLIDLEVVEGILYKALMHNIIVVVDEAYGDYVSKNESAIGLIRSYPNLIVMRSMSKGFGLAGIRAGYLVASKNIMKYIRKLTTPYFLSDLTRDIITKVLSTENQIFVHSQKNSNYKQILRNNIGRGLHMAATDDRVSICALFHSDSEIDLRKEFAKEGINVVSGTDFDNAGQSFVRVRMPSENYFQNLIRAVKNIDLL